MNVLPLVLLLILILSAFTIKQVENFKNTEILKKEYREFIQEREQEDLNNSNQNCYDGGKYYKTRKLNFRLFFNRSTRKPEDQQKFDQLKKLVKELIRVLYADAAFYKKIEKKRPQFVDEILDEIIRQSDDTGKLIKGQIENLGQIKLPDSELQEAFYYMLKGTLEREDVESYRMLSQEYAEKSYPSLLNFLQKQANESYGSRPHTVPLHSAPAELLLAIYGKEEEVLKILNKQQELNDSTLRGQDKSADFKEFMKTLPATEFKDIIDY